MYAVPEHLDPDDHAPEIGGEEADVEEGGRREAEEEGRERVEDEEAERVAYKVPAHVPVPNCRLVIWPVEDGALDAHDYRPVEAQLAEDFVHGPFADEVFLRHVGEAVECRAQQCKEVTFDLVDGGTAVCAHNVVRRDEYAHTANANEDSDDLSPVVAHAEEYEGDDDDHDDGPEVDELGAEDVGVLVGKDNEIVAFDVAESENDIWDMLDRTRAFFAWGRKAYTSIRRAR